MKYIINLSNSLFLIVFVFVVAGCSGSSDSPGHDKPDIPRDEGERKPNKTRKSPSKKNTNDVDEIDIIRDLFNQKNQPVSNENDDIFKVYKDDDIKQTFNDLAGVEEAKKALRTIINYLRDPEAFMRLGATSPTGMIFYGPPGTGKTAIARAFAGEVNQARKTAFIVASGSSFENKYVGVGADNVRKLFALARAWRDKGYAVVIFIDEFDAVAGKRSEERKNAQVVNALLTELDGFDKKARKDIFVIAATNLLGDLDPALTRPGRFDGKIEIGLPHRKARRLILKKFFMNEKHEIKGVDMESILDATRGWSIAELEALVNQARVNATTNGKNKVADEDFDEAINFINAGRPVPPAP